jgi:hypothetical protein
LDVGLDLFEEGLSPDFQVGALDGEHGHGFGVVFEIDDEFFKAAD